MNNLLIAVELFFEHSEILVPQGSTSLFILVNFSLGVYLSFNNCLAIDRQLSGNRPVTARSFTGRWLSVK